MLVHPDRRGDEALLDVIRKMAADTGPDTFLVQQRAIMSRKDSRPSLEAIEVPTLLIRGDHDGITTQAHQDEILAAVPESRLKVIADCGHLPMLELPHEVNRILRAWLG